MSSFIRLREFRERYLSGEFNDSSFATMVQAGWYDWFCPDSELAGRLKRLWDEVISRIADDRVLDEYTLFFKNVCPISYPLFDRVYFCKTGSNYYIGADINDRRNKEKFEVFSSDESNYRTDDANDAATYIEKALLVHLASSEEDR